MLRLKDDGLTTQYIWLPRRTKRTVLVLKTRKSAEGKTGDASLFKTDLTCPAVS